MNKIFLKEILDVLVLVRTELSKHAESDVNLELDRIIGELELEIEKDVSINAHEVLALVGNVLDKIPSIVRLIELLSS